jgi:hypothetical protein
MSCNIQIIFEKYNANNKVKEFKSFVVRHHKADYPQLAIIQIVSPGKAFPTKLKTVSSPDPLTPTRTSPSLIVTPGRCVIFHSYLFYNELDGIVEQQ